MAETLLRSAGDGDVDLVARLLGEFYAEAGYAFDEPAARRAIARLAGDPGLGRLWLVLAGDEPVGYVAVTFGFSLEYLGRDAFVDDFYIREAHRGRGLGTRVMEEVEDACRELEVRALHLEVERDNRRGQALYRRRGFRDNDRQLLTKLLSG